MLFTSNTSEDIFTPIGTLGERNPFFTSHDPFPSDEFNGESVEKDQFINLDLTDFDFEEFSMEKETHPSTDLQSSTFAEESMLLPVPDESLIEPEDSTAMPWIGEECTIGSSTNDDTYSPAPESASSTGSVATVRSRSARQHHLTLSERKSRKKEQNKTAAEKYRSKKRLERDTLIKREADLKKENRDLKSEFESMKNRLEQFKQLFVNVLEIPIPPN